MLTKRHVEVSKCLNKETVVYQNNVPWCVYLDWSIWNLNGNMCVTEDKYMSLDIYVMCLYPVYWVCILWLVYVEWSCCSVDIYKKSSWYPFGSSESNLIDLLWSTGSFESTFVIVIETDSSWYLLLHSILCCLYKEVIIKHYNVWSHESVKDDDHWIKGKEI